MTLLEVGGPSNNGRKSYWRGFKDVQKDMLIPGYLAGHAGSR